jgi:hypothetical protein
MSIQIKILRDIFVFSLHNERVIFGIRRLRINGDKFAAS